LLCRRTALHIASENGHTETVKALVAAGADVHCKNSDGYDRWRCIAGLSVSASVAERADGFSIARAAQLCFFCCVGTPRSTLRFGGGTQRR
jgi:hypothetical protein